MNSVGDLNFGHNQTRSSATWFLEQPRVTSRQVRGGRGRAGTTVPGNRVSHKRPGGGPGRPRGWMASHPRSSAPGSRATRPRRGGAFPPSRDTSWSSSPARAPSRTRGGKHRYVIRVRLRLPLGLPASVDVRSSARGRVYVPASRRRGQGAKTAGRGRAVQRAPGRAAFGCSPRG